MTILKLALIPILGLAAMQEAKVPNDEYAAWARCSVHSWVRFKTTADDVGRKTESFVTVKLIEMTSDRAFLEIRTARIVRGHEVVDQVERREVPARVAKNHRSDGSTFEVNSGGTEALEVKDRVLNCRWVDMTLEKNGVRSRFKEWTSDEMVGGVVRSESDVPVTLHVTDWEKR